MEQKLRSNRWVVSANEASQLISQGATVLDTRSILAWLLGHVPGAVHITWQQFSQSKPPDKGKLLQNSDVLEQKLRAVGVSNVKPVIVVGNPAHNFGEEGRIVWMLHTLGHSQAAFVDGGYAALVQVDIPISRGLTQLQKRGDFVVRRTALWEIGRDQLKANLAVNVNIEDLVVIDTREFKEYAGATPYGEVRGGHIPRAVHFYFKDLMDINGYLLPHKEILAELNKLGIQQDSTIVAYCTGGVRSAWLIAVLCELGFENVKNYAGSMWEWSASSRHDYPLIIDT